MRHLYRETDTSATGSGGQIDITTSLGPTSFAAVGWQELTRPAELNSTVFATAPIIQESIMAAAALRGAIFQWQRWRIFRQENLVCYSGNTLTGDFSGTHPDRAPIGVR